MQTDENSNVSRNTEMAAMTLLDLVLGEWLSSTSVTTLLTPKIVMTSMCFPTKSSEVTPSQKADFSVRVEAFGSGAIIVPRLPVHAGTTTIGDLFDSVRQHDGTNDFLEIQLFFEERELCSHHSCVLLSDVINGTNVKPETTVIVNAVTLTLKQVNAIRELLHLFHDCYAIRAWY